MGISKRLLSSFALLVTFILFFVCVKASAEKTELNSRLSEENKLQGLKNSSIEVGGNCFNGGYPCSNPDCLYLHEIGSQEYSFTKDEIILAYTRTGMSFICLLMLGLQVIQALTTILVIIRQLEVTQAAVTLISGMGAIMQIILLGNIQTTLKIQVGLMPLVLQV
ncbi:hypothetical protein J1N35_008071 [Gossypium stocksii]|uniref:C3H1-type domain-containing protein n=1 Tax=Gossypium stocksii TaxID=47602 RepID=A0A9D3W9Q0_9ROSI|nr:hypothetical protein J1N35_008071 [Gossypium stocksii]